MTLLLDGSEIARLLPPAAAFAAVGHGLRLYRDGQAAAPQPMHVRASHGGGFHAKAATLGGGPVRFALKLNANFPGNPALGLPTIQGVLLLCDGEDGRLLALMDSIELTRRRTAAASALAARCLAPVGAARLALIGCGAQGLPHLAALTAVLPQLSEVALWDRDAGRAHALAADAGGVLGPAIRCQVAATLHEATAGAAVVVSCTPSQVPILGPAEVDAGALVLAVGADHPHKNEIAPALMAMSRVVVDDLAQCLAMGDLRHAVAAGAMAGSQVHASLGALLDLPPRAGIDARSRVVFDSTGLGLYDVACAALVWERAVEAGAGTPWSLH